MSTIAAGEPAMTIRASLALFTLLFGPVAAHAQNVCKPAELTTRFGDWDPDAAALITGSQPVPIVPKTADGSPTQSMRLLIAMPNPGNKKWSLVIRDQDGRLAVQLQPSDFAKPDATMWTGRIAGGAVTLQLRDADAATQLEVRGATANRPANSMEQAFSISGPVPAWRDVYPLHIPSLQVAAEAVGIFVDDALDSAPDAPPGKRLSWCCSGVVIGKGLFLTNWHCAGPGGLWNDAVIGNAVIDLAWDGGRVRRQFTVEGVAVKDEALDFAILRIAPSAGADGAIRATYPVRVSTAPVTDLQQIVMIHHAQCRPKKISDNCRVQQASRRPWTDPQGATGQETEIAHGCDTEAGASGSPIFDLQGRLIALHHLGFQKVGTAICPMDRLNKAVKISAIIDFVKRSDAELARKLGW
jgi:hypothetical protein